MLDVDILEAVQVRTFLNLLLESAMSGKKGLKFLVLS